MHIYVHASDLITTMVLIVLFVGIAYICSRICPEGIRFSALEMSDIRLGESTLSDGIVHGLCPGYHDLTHAIPTLSHTYVYVYICAWHL
jgi:hypothetical protein